MLQRAARLASDFEQLAGQLQSLNAASLRGEIRRSSALGTWPCVNDRVNRVNEFIVFRCCSARAGTRLTLKAPVTLAIFSRPGPGVPAAEAGKLARDLAKFCKSMEPEWLEWLRQGPLVDPVWQWVMCEGSNPRTATHIHKSLMICGILASHKAWILSYG